MSENNDTQVLEGSAAGEDTDINGYVHAELSVNTSPTAPRADGGEVPVSVEPVDAAAMGDSADKLNHVDHNNEVPGTMDNLVHDNTYGAKASEDGGKEDMFVDCPDELIYDVRTIDNREVMKIPDTLDEKDDMHGACFNESSHEMHVHDLMGEQEHRPAILDKTVADKDGFSWEYEEERVELMRGLVFLRHQLKALNEQPLLLNANDGLLVDNLYRAEVGEGEEKILETDASLHEIIKECSTLLKTALDERSQTDGTVRELHAILYMKDQEIADLNARVTELSVANDIVHSYLNSTQEISSRSLDVLSDVKLEKEQHIEAMANRMLASLATAVNQEEFLDESLIGKISQVEKSSSLIIEKHNRFLFEIDLLRQCLTKVKPDLSVQDEMEVFVSARNSLLEHERQEIELNKKLSHLVDENRKLVEQLDKNNAEFGSLNVELEQEKSKYANTKEKLSMAVTKGKALVQQRDLLKQSLADKTNELEKCLIELQEKSVALEAAELTKEELAKSENLTASLQAIVSQKDMILERCEEILSQTVATEMLESTDIIEKVRWLTHERITLKEESSEYHKLGEALSSIDLPETVLSSSLESRAIWLLESFSLANDEAIKLQDELARIKEGSSNEIDHLTALLLAESLEKNSLQEELGDLTQRYEQIVDKEHRLSLEKSRMVSLLFEASGITVDSEDDIYQLHSDTIVLIDSFIQKIKEKAIISLESSYVEAEIFERIKSVLYMRHLESMLYEQILEVEMQDGSEVNRLSNELALVSQEVCALKDEKVTLQNDLERSEEKTALLREKLSMAVKKGKGLVQERDNLKQILEEKNTEIEKLKLELQQLESTCRECKDQIAKLFTDLKHIPKLEADLVAMQNQRDQLEQFLVESNGLLQRVIELIDGITLPVDSVFEEPVEKVKWLVGYFSECQIAKAEANEELRRVKDEAQTAVKSLEEALSITENKVSQLTDEKKELLVSKEYVEQELQKAMKEASSHTSKFDEVCASRKSLEDALSLAENKMSLLMNEIENAQVDRAVAERELQKKEEEASTYTSKLTDAYRTIQSLEDTLSQMQTNISLLTEENTKAKVDTTELDNEVKRLKQEIDSRASVFADASSTIKSLEDALFKAENTISKLAEENKIAEQEISVLNSKLNACMQELAGAHGSLENRSLTLAGHLRSLQLLLKDQTLFSLLRQDFEKKVRSLIEMDLLLKDMKDHIAELQNRTTEEDSSLPNAFPSGPDNVVDTEIINDEVNVVDNDSVTFYVGRTVEEFHMRNKILTEKFEGFNSFMDELIAALLKKLQTTRDKVAFVVEQMNSLKQNMNNMETEKEAQQNTIVMLENDITILLSACTDATQELELEVGNNILDPGSVPERENLKCTLSTEVRAVGGDAVAEHQLRPTYSRHVETAKKLLLAARNGQNLCKDFLNVRNNLSTKIEVLRNELEENRKNCEKAIRERDQNQERTSKLETDLGALENMCSEMRLKLEAYQAKEKTLEEREAELSSTYANLLTKEQAAGDLYLSASQIKYLFDKINRIEIPVAGFEVEDSEPSDLGHVEKLFHIVDNFSELQHQMTLLSHEKEKLQATLANEVLEVDQLKEEVEKCIIDKQDSEMMRDQLLKLAIGLETIIQKLGGDELVGGQKSVGATGLLPVLEKLVMSVILESENSKSKVQELGASLLGAQKVMDELSNKVKLLEDSNQSRIASPESVLESGILEATSLPTRSDISEIEDVGTVGKNTISSAPSTAHVRTLRKASSDNLAINIDSESDHFISDVEAGDDKGHVFKSLNTSGLIPIPGKMIADRIDGIWVSGNRALMSRPRARLGLIAYSLFLHLWLLISIL